MAKKIRLNAYVRLFIWFMVQYLFVGHTAGISVLLSVAGFYSLYFYAIKGRLGGFEPWEGQNNAGWLLLIPVVFLL